jgi:serine protease Do
MPTASRLGGTALAVAAVLAITVCGGASASAESSPPQVPSPERAVATVHPALVRVTGTFVGWVHDRQGGYANDGRAYTLTLTCSGFGVHSDGYLATAGHSSTRTTRRCTFPSSRRPPRRPSPAARTPRWSR